MMRPRQSTATVAPRMRAARPAHVIWDWNGTLLDDAWLCVEIMNGLLAKRSLPALTLRRYREIFDFPVASYYRRLGFDFAAESFEELGTEFILEYERRRLECALRPAAERVLTHLAETAVSQSLLSAYRQDTLEELVDHFRLRRLFASLIGLSDHYAAGKLSRAQEYARQLACRRHELLLIGDTVHDHEVAQALGADCLLVEGGHQSRSRLRATGLPVLRSLGGILKRMTA